MKETVFAIGFEHRPGEVGVTHAGTEEEMRSASQVRDGSVLFRFEGESVTPMARWSAGKSRWVGYDDREAALQEGLAARNMNQNLEEMQDGA